MKMDKTPPWAKRMQKQIKNLRSFVTSNINKNNFGGRNVEKLNISTQTSDEDVQLLDDTIKIDRPKEYFTKNYQPIQLQVQVQNSDVSLFGSDASFESDSELVYSDDDKIVSAPIKSEVYVPATASGKTSTFGNQLKNEERRKFHPYSKTQKGKKFTRK